MLWLKPLDRKWLTAEKPGFETVRGDSADEGVEAYRAILSSKVPIGAGEGSENK